MATIRRRTSYRNDFGTRHFSRDLTELEITNLLDYLDNPVKSGIWTYTLKLDRKKGIFGFFLNNINPNITSNGEASSESSIEERMRKTGDYDGMKTISFVFYVFARLCDSVLRYPDLEVLYERINIDLVRENYKEALGFFRDYLFFDSFYSRVERGELTALKDSFFVLYNESNSDYKYNDSKSDYIEIVSLGKDQLSNIQQFFEMVDICNNGRIRPIYSPEEHVFKPYFSFLEVAYKHLIDEQSIEMPLKRSINEYKTEEYSYCVSTIGLIAESYIAQIYETYFRDFCPRKFTLGQLYDAIDTETKKCFPSKVIEKPDIDVIFTHINELNKEGTEKHSTNEQMVSILREIVHFIKEDSKFIIEHTEKREKKNDSHILFPRKIRDNINDIIKYRNAVSHNSRIHIGYYEALKTAYYCITLIRWWQTEQEKIDWDKNPEEILKEAIERNKAS